MSDLKLTRIQEAYVKKMERQKVARELALIRMKKRNRLFLFGGLIGVFGIYFYTISTFKQETFLEQLDLDIAREREKANEQK